MASTDVVLSPENKAFTLVARKNIRDNEAKKAAHMANIEKATGVTGWVFDFEGEPAALEKSLEGNLFFSLLSLLLLLFSFYLFLFFPALFVVFISS